MAEDKIVVPLDPVAVKPVLAVGTAATEIAEKPGQYTIVEPVTRQVSLDWLNREKARKEQDIVEIQARADEDIARKQAELDKVLALINLCTGAGG